MKKILTTKFFIAVIFFCIGFLTNHLLTKLNQQPPIIGHDGVERFPVNPADFDHDRMLDTIRRMGEDEAGNMRAGSTIGTIAQREDDKNVYYDIPLKDHNGVNHKLNVEINNGMVKITEDIKDQDTNSNSETSSERMFSIDPALDGDKAEVINEKEKVVIRIPKR